MIRLDQTRPDHDHNYALYTDQFYEYNASEKHLISAKRIISAVREFIPLRSVIDIGCGVGNILKACLDSGARTVRGVDGSWLNPKMLVIPHERFSQQDITLPGLKEKIPEKNFDLTISSEVGEHIEAKYSDIYVDNLVSFSNVILFGAAVPFSGGTNHVNEQWPSYWAEKFRARGFVPVDCLRPRVWNDSSIVWFYRQNLVFYVRRECLKDYPALEAEAGRPLLDIVHPEKWLSRIKEVKEPEIFYNGGFKKLCRHIFTEMRYLFPVLFRALRRRIFHEKS